MLKKFFYSLFILFLSCLFFPDKAKADAFVVHFNYDAPSKKLFFEQGQDPVSHDENASAYITDYINDQSMGPYILSLTDSQDTEIFSTQFDVQSGNFTVTIPYFSLAKTLKIIKKSENKEILSADLSSFITCNGNGVCEYEKGESLKTCIGDCGKTNTQFSPETLKLLQDNKGILRDSKTNEIILRGNQQDLETKNNSATQGNNLSFLYTIMIVIIVIILGLLAYLYIFKKSE